MKEADAQKEKERVELETYKRENPEEYEQMIAHQEEDRRQQAEFKKRERMIAAAMERKKRADAGLPEADEPAPAPKQEKQQEEKQNQRQAPPPPPAQQTSVLQAGLCFAFIIAVCAVSYLVLIKQIEANTKPGKEKKKNKKA